MQTNWINQSGTFKARVVKPNGGWFHESSEKKTPYIAVYLEILEDVDCEGMLAKFTGYLSEKALPNTMRTLWQCFRFNGELSDLHEGRTTFEGMDVQITVEEESYNGKTRHKVKWMNPVGYTPTAPGIEESTAKVLIASLTAKAKAAAKEAEMEFAPGVTGSAVAPAPKKPASNPNPAPGPTDDVPF